MCEQWSEYRLSREVAGPPPRDDTDSHAFLFVEIDLDDLLTSKNFVM